MISIVMAAYNGASFIAEQIESILAQTHTNWELIICDDGSTDQTQAIAEAYTKKDPRIQLHVNEVNLGLNKNFEKAIGFAKGDYIAISDQDDLWRNDKLEKLIGLFIDEDVMMVHGQSIRFSETPPTDIRFNHKRNLLTGQQPAQSLYFNTIAGHNILFRKSMLSEHPKFPEGIFYDWWLVMLASCKGKVKATSEVLSFHRHHTNNVTLGKKDEKKQSKAKAMERLKALEIFIRELPLDEDTSVIATALQSKLMSLQQHVFSWSLFLFLLRHAGTFFFFKKQKVISIGRMKICYRMSWAQ